jgi:hypothetical protein
MSRPAVEVADILRAQGSHFLNKYPSSFGYQKLKAFRAIQNCRTAALGGHLDACSECGQHRPSPTTPAVTGTAPSARRKPVSVGWRRASARCCRPAIFTLSSASRTNSTSLRWKTHARSTTCYLRPVPPRHSRWQLTPNVSALRLASSVFCIPGGKICCSILIFTASFRREASRPINAIGSLLAIASFCRSRLYAVSFAASLSMD